MADTTRANALWGATLDNEVDIETRPKPPKLAPGGYHLILFDLKTRSSRRP